MTEPLRASQLGDIFDQLASFMQNAGLTLRQAVDQFERRFLECTLVECGFNKTRAARHAGMHRNTLDRRITELNIDLHELRGLRPPRRKFSSGADRDRRWQSVVMLKRRPNSYASKERPASASGETAALLSSKAGRESSALAPVQQSSPAAMPGDSVRKGGRGESLEPLSAGAVESNRSSGISFSCAPGNVRDLDCGGLSS